MTPPIPIFLLVPFALLLLMIATGPVLYPHFWERFYAGISGGLAALVVGYYIFIRHDYEAPIEAAADYVQFIVLIAALYMAAGGILIEVPRGDAPWANLALLWSGAVLSNFVGTTGASMLLIRPYIRLNGKRIAPYHIVFFIFMVSNVGGVLTAVGDPPLLRGFLKGVPFLWTLHHGWLPWGVALLCLSVIFYGLERRRKDAPVAQEGVGQGTLRIAGYLNVFLLLCIGGVVLLDPHIIPGLPTVDYHGHRYSFVREGMLGLIALGAHRWGDREIHQANGFSLAPLKEVVYTFLGIFGTMIPAIQCIKVWACSPQGALWITPPFLYWATGLLSSVLDNAPTYLNFLAAGMSAQGLTLEHAQEVLRYAGEFPLYLKATSLGAVFFGAMSYVGNGPNFMVRAIAEEQGVKMPSFGRYISHFALVYLFPVLVLVGVLFFGLPRWWG